MRILESNTKAGPKRDDGKKIKLNKMCEDTSSFPLLLDPKEYNPDTVDLKSDEEARDYWFECFNGLIKKFSVQAALSQRNDPTANDRASNFYEDYINKIDKLKTREEYVLFVYHFILSVVFSFTIIMQIKPISWICKTVKINKQFWHLNA